MNKLLIPCAMLAFSLSTIAQTKIIAHRGYWKADGSAQNSITALVKAAEAKVYGSEFDVQLTADKNIVVNHDDSINGMAVSDVSYAKLKQVKLKNGELLPTLDDYLKAGKAHPSIKMILEIKPHRTADEENTVTALTVRKVKEMGMEDQVEYISFSMNICEQLVRLTPSSQISYLRSDVAPKDLKAKGINGIDYYYKVLAQKPEWIKEAHNLGMKVNAWTVNEPDDIRSMHNLNVDFITTDIPVEAKKIVTDK